MFCYDALGDRNAALRQYETCKRVLREELAAEPSPETTALYQRLQQAPAPALSPGASAAALTNLPTPLTSFVGRAQEIAEVKRLLTPTPGPSPSPERSSGEGEGVRPLPARADVSHQPRSVEHRRRDGVARAHPGPARRHRPPDALLRREGIRLFVERAAAASPNFTLTPANADPVLQICRRLDGIPLAIELAAARLKALSVEQIAARPDDRFKLLTSGGRTALPRQQTLRALMDWSYDLLSEPERGLFRRLAVFVGGRTLEAVEAVCSDKDEVRRMKDETTPIPPSSFILPRCSTC